ncbi:alginate regulatory protein [Anaerocolumna cellulosilytica]|uniref:Alginate regulatory protein n=1 Tax=Anaerocolumna cellulosilytica TaxID=433286 RepID=A0A6S6R1K3_9FIRM|nr:MBOAT family protein [Anaerocolumna cellulosilytica]MBB5195434.1 alginate O-acetyltransferase complex protein AlgI [Anaerocolumna cellulosilytica]BCJ95966.1 alginate regulatory protein [Anaerocolumna cellulosilytica]
MLFSSLLFLFQFMPIFFLIYYILPVKWRNSFLFIASIIFYGWGEPRFLVLIFTSISINYISGRLIEHYDDSKIKNHLKKRKAVFLLSLLYNVGTLLLFKYANFIIENINQVLHLDMTTLDITLPLGISFYTFQIISYVIDVYRRDIKAEGSFINLGVYLSLFPQLIAGPIVVYKDIAAELKSRSSTLEQIEEGLKIFVLGLGAKVLIANNVGKLWEELGSLGYSNLSMPLAWLGIIAYTLQIYFDFSGYSLMAIGLGKMMGFQFPINFNYPYISKSITEFWRRWHITLSSWFRDYIYIPLGGSRKGRLCTFINLFLVWSITGLWHGASWNFILWGIYFFILLLIEKLFLKKWLDKSAVISRVYTLLLVCIGWMIFAITDFNELGQFMRSAFSFQIEAGGKLFLYYLKNYLAIISMGIFLSMPVFRRWFEKHKKGCIANIILTLILLLSVAYLVDASYNPFLYFRF